ncbi:hypothetical protein ACOSP7_019194 [Xanthoceras sorbifolium]
MYKDQNPCTTYRYSTNNRSQQWILAEYLGEDQIVVVLCRSFGTACALEIYEHTVDVAVMSVEISPPHSFGTSNVSRFHVQA